MRAPDRTPGGWWWDWTKPTPLIAPAAPSVQVEDNPVVSQLFGPRGEVIKEARVRQTVEFGYCAPAREGDRHA